MTWPHVRLSRLVADVVDGPFGSNLTSAHYSDDGARVVRLGNIGAGRFKDEGKAFIPIAHYTTLKRHEVLAGDLLVAGLGDEQHPVGRACLAPDNLGPAIVKADCFRLRLDEDRLSHRFAMWFLNSTFAGNAIEMESRGSTRTRATPGAITAIGVRLPPLQEQRRIGSVTLR
jgi:type I restriction enzyme S subunit